MARYEELFAAGLTLRATVPKNVNVLLHIMGYFRKELTGAEKRELLDLVDQYRQRLVPLIAPLTLLRHYLAQYPHPWLAEQVYLIPHPAELMLRNHA